MRFSTSSVVTLFSTFLAFSPFASAIRLIESKSLNPCQDNSNFTATLFNVVFTPDNRTLAFDIVGVSSIQGNVTAQLQVIAYGLTILNQTLDPCTNDLGGLCPMNTGQINIESNYIVGEDVVKEIPGIAYGVPDLDGIVRVSIMEASTSRSLACVEARLSNTKTVDQKAVGWATAVIAGLALIASGITSGMGHTNTAAHVAANALSLFGYFQGQAIIGMTAVEMPPIVQSWTQNFQWSMGIIRLGFLQSICTWYLRATGGTPTTYLSTLATTSVSVQKRSLEIAATLAKRGFEMVKRSNTGSSVAETSRVVVVRGIDRVGFRAGIEQTNIFLTGMIFFLFFCFLVVVLVGLFKGFCELAVKWQWMKHDTFFEFRNGWKIVMKGILFRLVLLGYPQMCILCLWELFERDSAGEVVLAIFVFLSMSFALGWASLKVVNLAKKSVVMHKNPAYMLYSDPTCLNKWGFLYVQYRATAYWFIVPILAYILAKSIFIAFAQEAHVVQAIGLVIIEAVLLIAVSVLRPWMDKKTNVFNISIAAVNFLNAIFLLVFTAVFGQPAIVTGVMGVVFVFYNVVFALVLLILVLIASIYAICSKNPDNRYQPMRDDRGSFIKSQPQLTTELDALGATARGDVKAPYTKPGFDDDDSFSSGSINRQQRDASAMPLPPSTANSNHQPPPTAQSGYQRSERHSPVHDSSMMYPSNNSGRRGPSPPNSNNDHQPQHDIYSHYAAGDHDQESQYNQRPLQENRQPSPYSGYNNGGGGEGSPRTGSAHSNRQQQPQSRFRQDNNSSPWQRGRGMIETVRR